MCLSSLPSMVVGTRPYLGGVNVEARHRGGTFTFNDRWRYWRLRETPALPVHTSGRDTINTAVFSILVRRLVRA